MPSVDLHEIYHALLNHFRHRNWWPGDTPLEVIVGAILTQNTAWKNVEKAIGRLKEAGVLSIKGLRTIPREHLAELIRPSGYYNQKALKIKAFLAFLQREYRGNLTRMFREDTRVLREKLLQVKGIGPETADSILLYAGGHLTFVVDLYTYRVATRHGWVPEDIDYESLREFFQDRIRPDVELYNDFHAQLVAVGNQYCRKTPCCEECLLYRFILTENIGWP